jgi:hypothetical protein
MPPVKNVGEPCAGEPHARFDAAAGGNQASRQARTAPAPPADPTATPRPPCFSASSEAAASNAAVETPPFRRKRKPLRRRLAGHGRLGWGPDKAARPNSIDAVATLVAVSSSKPANALASLGPADRGSDPEPTVTALLPEPERRFPVLWSAEP